MLRRSPGRDVLRQRFGLDPRRTTFLFCGKFVDKKRPSDVVEAIRAACAEGAQVQALLVGSGPLEADLRRRAEGLPVRFGGFLNQSEVAAAYVAADALVLPSTCDETWGLVVNEAMASGIPALISDQVGCAPDLIVPEVTGECFGCGDVAALARLMFRHAGQGDRLAEMGRAAHERVSAHFTIGGVARGVLASLQSLPGAKAA